MSVMRRLPSGRAKGFTIVELLIVVVIIAILAAITLVTYSGIQQRASNTAIIDAASKTYRMVQAYIAANSAYPYTAGNSCVTSGSGCLSTSGSSVGVSTTFDTNMATIGSLPRSIPVSGSTMTGITYDYTNGRTVDGNLLPVVIFYWLMGTSQQCGLAGVVTLTSWPVMASTSAGYTSSGSGKTFCVVSVSGPSA